MKKVLNIRTISLFFAALVAGIYFASSYIFPQNEFAFIVKMQKEFREDFSHEEVVKYVAEGYPVPVNSKNPALDWNIDTMPLLLVVTIQNDGQIKLNNESNGDLSNTQILNVRLAKIFDDRVKYEVYEEKTNKIFKKVIIRATPSTKYGDVVKVIDAVKESGAEPIVLQIDDLPN